MAASPLMEASTLDLEMVKLLIKAGADPYKKLKQNQETPFANSVSSGNYDILNYFIDSLKVDVKQPMRVRKNDSLYIQDYIEKFMGYKEGTEGDKKKQQLIQKLESMGVDFKNYSYKR
jgi:hypothetical protein